MKPTIKPIPQTINGVTFRSSLEARVSLTLTTNCIEWHYEPEGFELGNGVRYKPDFWLPEIDTWLEVKYASDAPGVNKAAMFAEAVCGDDRCDPEQLVMIVYPGKINERDYLPGHNALGASCWFVECETCNQRQWLTIGADLCRRCGRYYNKTEECVLHGNPDGWRRDQKAPVGFPVLYGEPVLVRLPQWTARR